MNSIKSMLWYNNCAITIVLIDSKAYIMAAVLFIMSTLCLFSKEEA